MNFRSLSKTTNQTILTASIFIIMFSLPGNVWGANVYIDPTYNGTQLGTFDKPYNSWNDFSITTGNDYFQKCGTSWTGSVTISNSGADGNRILLSAYYIDGGVVHESDKPSFGEKCGNNANKPIITDTDQVGSVVDIDGANYIELNSLQLKKGFTTVYTDGNYNYIQFCRVMDGQSGIRVGLGSQSNYNYIGYNYLYGFDPAPQVDDLDGIQLAGWSNYNTVEYNTVDGYTHAGIKTNVYASYNEIRFNYVESHDDHLDMFLETNGDHNKFHHNYCNDCGNIQITEADSNEIAYNVIDGITSNPHHAPGIGAITLSPTLDDNAIIDNKIYNNIVYDRRDGWTNPVGILLMSHGTRTGCSVERNEIVNNIFLNFDSTVPPIRVWDKLNHIESDDSDPDANRYKNNLAYDFTDDYYADIEGKRYKTGALFNSRDDVSGNREDYPGLKNPSGGQFWPDDAKNNVVGNGFNLVSNGFKLGLAPEYQKPFDPKKTVFSKSKITVVLKEHWKDKDKPNEPEKWYIGPYALTVFGEDEEWDLRKQDRRSENVYDINDFKKKDDSDSE